LVLQELHQVRREGPHLDEVALLAVVLGGWNVHEPEKFGNVRRSQFLDVGRTYLDAVLEETVKEESTPIAFGARALEVDEHRVHAMDLLVSISRAVPHRHDEHEQLRALLRDLREDLDEVEGPVLPRVLLRVRETIEPRLELVQQESRGLLL